ncbi:MAG TPA: hypothetical protein VFC56_19900 [Stellaceae bacterium]|nr:hypothetical protein [Stellaceae bacterium]
MMVVSGMAGFGLGFGQRLRFVEELLDPIEAAEKFPAQHVKLVAKRVKLVAKRVKTVLGRRFEGADLDADCDHEIVVLRYRVATVDIGREFDLLQVGLDRLQLSPNEIEAGLCHVLNPSSAFAPTGGDVIGERLVKPGIVRTGV